MKTNKRRFGKKGGILRCGAGIVLAAAVIFNAMSFEGIAVSASDGMDSGLCEHHPEHDESCTFVCEICSGETSGDNKKNYDSETGNEIKETKEKAGTLEAETKDETRETEEKAGTLGAETKDETRETEEKAGILEAETEDETRETEEKAGTLEVETEDETKETEEKAGAPETEVREEQEETEEKAGILEAETEDETKETDKGQTEPEEPLDMSVMNALKEPVDMLAVYALEEELEMLEVEIEDKTAESTNLDVTELTTPSGNLDTDGYCWEGSEGSYKLTLQDITISGTVTLPDDTVTIVTKGNCFINALEIKNDNPWKTKLIFSGGGELTITERISIFGNDGLAMTIATGARVQAKNGIAIGTSGYVSSVITVKGILTINGGENEAISAGQVIVGAGGTLNVSGTRGVMLNGINNGSINFKGAFTVENGGCFNANCTEFNVRVGSASDNAISVPDGYLPDDCKVKQDETDNTSKLVHKDTGTEYTGLITIHENHVWSKNWEKDETKHWKECTYEGCDKKNEEGGHNFNNGTQCTCGANLTVSLTGIDGLVYDGQAKMPDVTVKVDGKTLGEENYTKTYSKNIDAGEASVTIKGESMTFEQTKTFVIGKATPTITWKNTAQNLNYTGSAAAITAPTVMLVNNETYKGTIQYSYAVKDSNEFKNGLPADAGTYTVKVRIAEQGNYIAAESGNITLTITCSHNNTEIRGQKDANCTEKGNTGDTYCKDCNTKIESGNEIPALEHDWHAESKNGKRIYTCFVCGATRNEAVQKPTQSEGKHSHSYKEGVLENATCTKVGTAIYTCDCGEKYTEIIPALRHKYTHKVTTEPTIFTEGVLTYTCSRCWHRYTESIPKLGQHGHIYAAMVLKEATCTEEGIRMYACACGNTYTESIPMLIHSYDSKVTQKPTVSAEGVITYICIRCNDTYTKPIDKIEGALAKADSRTEIGNPFIKEETDNVEEQNIVTADADTDADASVDADTGTGTDTGADTLVVTPTKPMEPIEADVVDNLSQTENQFPWWILLIVVLVIIMGVYVAKRQRNKKEQV